MSHHTTHPSQGSGDGVKAISIRHFNANVKHLTEPVEIVTLDREAGTVRTLGVYYPNGTHPKSDDLFAASKALKTSK
jgi:hypothetical protein